jgi:hypothetical protein
MPICTVIIVIKVCIQTLKKKPTGKILTQSKLAHRPQFRELLYTLVMIFDRAFENYKDSR